MVSLTSPRTDLGRRTVPGETWVLNAIWGLDFTCLSGGRTPRERGTTPIDRGARPGGQPARRRRRLGAARWAAPPPRRPGLADAQDPGAGRPARRVGRRAGLARPPALALAQPQLVRRVPDL